MASLLVTIIVLYSARRPFLWESSRLIYHLKLWVPTLLPDERHDTLRDALISKCINMRPLDGPLAVIRTNPPPPQLSHGPRQQLSLSRPQNCSWDWQSQESKQKPRCGKSGLRTWTWAPSTGSPWWATLPCCNLCRKRNPELTNSLSWIVSSWNVDAARSALKHPVSTKWLWSDFSTTEPP